jgi:hypothetical protein
LILEHYKLKQTATPQKLATILHGAYGDYFEQLLCFVDLAEKYPQHTYHLFFANPYRMEEFLKLNLKFAKTLALHTEIENTDIDVFYQFQIFDVELKEEVLSNLSRETLSKFDFKHNLLPHIYMRSMQDKKQKRFTLTFNQKGEQSYNDIGSTLTKDFFKNKTIGFMWRYRSAQGAVSPKFMPNENVLKDKYSTVLEQAIKQWDCNVLVAGMKVKTTEENRFIVDAKFPEYGLNFKHDNLHYLPGKGWLAEVELIAQCDIVICNPSGFSEAIFLKGKECIVVDPPLHYVLKTIKNRFPLFNIGLGSPAQITELLRSIFQRHSKQFLTDRINKVLSKS